MRGSILQVVSPVSPIVPLVDVDILKIFMNVSDDRGLAWALELRDVHGNKSTPSLKRTQTRRLAGWISLADNPGNRRSGDPGKPSHLVAVWVRFHGSDICLIWNWSNRKEWGDCPAIAKGHPRRRMGGQVKRTFRGCEGGGFTTPPLVKSSIECGSTTAGR